MVQTTRLASIWSKTARRSRLIGSFCENIARLWSRETGETTRIPSSASIKQGALQQPASQRVYHPDHNPTRQSESEPQETLHSPQYSRPVNFPGKSRQLRAIVTYNSMEALSMIQARQVTYWSHQVDTPLYLNGPIGPFKLIASFPLISSRTRREILFPLMNLIWLLELID